MQMPILAVWTCVLIDVMSVVGWYGYMNFCTLETKYYTVQKYSIYYLYIYQNIKLYAVSGAMSHTWHPKCQHIEMKYRR